MNLPWTHAGMPVVSLPAGTTDGLPLGVQVAAPRGADERLLEWAQALEGVVADP
jgi:Asp-tRNA(Asn)/Glu-tRNA(Gln) amidotransferase A subunit family amidase